MVSLAMINGVDQLLLLVTGMLLMVLRSADLNRQRKLRLWVACWVFSVILIMGTIGGPWYLMEPQRAIAASILLGGVGAVLVFAIAGTTRKIAAFAVISLIMVFVVNDAVRLSGSLIGCLLLIPAGMLVAALRTVSPERLPFVRIIAATCIALVVMAQSYTGGIHLCDQGRPPLLIPILLGGISIVPVFAFGTMRRFSAAIALMLLAGIVLVSAWPTSHLAALYHTDTYTGNPNYGSDAYWHTFITGLYQRTVPPHPTLSPTFSQRKKGKRVAD